MICRDRPPGRSVYEILSIFWTVEDAGPYKVGVQNQKMPQFCVGTNVSFERNSKVRFTAVRYNISKGDNMDSKIEKEFVKSYIDKNYQERLLYELGSSKKRVNALSRFSHNAETILKKSVSKRIITSVGDFQEKDQTVYIISWDEKDGLTMPLSDAVRYLEASYMSVILIGKDFSLIKEEAENGCAKIFYLK